MTELQRQLLTAAAGIGIFLYLYLFQLLVLPFSIAGSVVTLLAVGLLVDAKPPPGLRWLAGARMSQDEFDALLLGIGNQESKLRKLAEYDIPEDLQQSVITMADDLRTVIDYCREDPSAVRPIRAYVQTYLNDIVTMIERYERLFRYKRDASTETQLAEVKRTIIEGFAPQVRRLQVACLNHDLPSLLTGAQISADVMDIQTRRIR